MTPRTDGPKPSIAEASAAIARASAALLGCDDFAQAAEIIYRACKEFVGAEAGYVQVIEGDESTVILADAEAGTPTPFSMPSQVLASLVLAEGRPVCVNAPEAEPGLVPRWHPAIHNVLGVPLVLRGVLVGFMTFVNKPGGFNENSAEWSVVFGEIMAAALASVRLRDDLKAATLRQRLLFEGPATPSSGPIRIPGGSSTATTRRSPSWAARARRLLACIRPSCVPRRATSATARTFRRPR
ncbi:MAG: GAF domain-containing protein [Actinobacteria bacterium]|nr:GAF domain-containing protein [Actinomycetota bacterium]